MQCFLAFYASGAQSTFLWEYLAFNTLSQGGGGLAFFLSWYTRENWIWEPRRMSLRRQLGCS